MGFVFERFGETLFFLGGRRDRLWYPARPPEGDKEKNESPVSAGARAFARFFAFCVCVCVCSTVAPKDVDDDRWPHRAGPFWTEPGGGGGRDRKAGGIRPHSGRLT